MMPPEVRSNLCRADALALEGDWGAVDDCFAAAVARDQSPTSRIAFASSLAERERYHEALCQMTAALDLASADCDREALSVIHHNLAAIYRELGDFGLAQRFQQRAILEMDNCGSDELLGLTNDAWLSNRRQLAESLAESAVELGDGAGPAIESEAMLAVISGLNSGNARDGIRSLLRAYRAHRAKSAYRLMGIDLLNLSLLFGEIGWPQGEISLVQRAIYCFDKAAASVSSAKAHRILALLTCAQSLRAFDPSRN
jgi:tetratricopeptide (TPR) repeat protein